MSYMKRSEILVPSNLLSAVNVILKVIGAFALVIWISSLGGGK